MITESQEAESQRGKPEAPGPQAPWLYLAVHRLFWFQESRTWFHFWKKVPASTFMQRRNYWKLPLHTSTEGSCHSPAPRVTPVYLWGVFPSEGDPWSPFRAGSAVNNTHRTLALGSVHDWYPLLLNKRCCETHKVDHDISCRKKHCWRSGMGRQLPWLVAHSSAPHVV